MSMRIAHHPILGVADAGKTVQIFVDNKPIPAMEGEMIAAALLANGMIVNRFTQKRNEPRGVFCGIGKCTDCVMIVDGIPNVRTCITPVKDGMQIQTQHGVGKGARDD